MKLAKMVECYWVIRCSVVKHLGWRLVALWNIMIVHALCICMALGLGFGM
jgi:hypothetical protein